MTISQNGANQVRLLTNRFVCKSGASAGRLKLILKMSTIIRLESETGALKIRLHLGF